MVVYSNNVLQQSIKDLFRPRYLHSSPDVRINAIKFISDINKIRKIIDTEPDDTVKQYAWVQLLYYSSSIDDKVEAFKQISTNVWKIILENNISGYPTNINRWKDLIESVRSYAKENNAPDILDKIEELDVTNKEELKKEKENEFAKRILKAKENDSFYKGYLIEPSPRRIAKVYGIGVGADYSREGQWSLDASILKAEGKGNFSKKLTAMNAYPYKSEAWKNCLAFARQEIDKLT